MGETTQATATLTNSIIGVTVLAMPYCFAQCGFILASLLLLLVSLAAVKSSEMLLASALAAKRGSYELLAHHAYGPAGKLAVELSMIGLSLGTLVAFHIIVGDLCPQVVSAVVGLDGGGEATARLRLYVMLAFAAGVILPLSLMRDPASLSKISFVSLAFYGVFLLHLMTMTLTAKVSIVQEAYLQNPYEPAYNWFRPSGVLYSLPIMGLAFSCQTQLFLLYDSLADPTIKVVKKIVTTSVASSCVFYILVGAIGYVACNAANPVIHGDLTAMYPNTPGCNLVRLILVMSVAVSFPVIVYPCRVSVFSLLYMQQSEAAAPDPPIVGVFIPEAKFRSITVAIVAGTLAGGILLPNVEFVLGITGALTGSLVCYVLPAGLHLATFRTAGRAAAAAILLAGLLTLCVTSFAVLAKQSRGGGGGGDVAAHQRLQPAMLRQLLPAAAGPAVRAPVPHVPLNLQATAVPFDANMRKPTATTAAAATARPSRLSTATYVYRNEAAVAHLKSAGRLATVAAAATTAEAMKLRKRQQPVAPMSFVTAEATIDSLGGSAGPS